MVWCMIILNSLFSNKGILTVEIESWKSFANSLDSDSEKELFKKMLNDYCNYAGIVVNANGKYFPSEPLVIALILSQHKKMINWLIEKVSEKQRKGWKWSVALNNLIIHTKKYQVSVAKEDRR